MSFKEAIEPLICLSTLHLTKETCDVISTPDQTPTHWPIVYPNEYGAFVYVNGDQFYGGPPDLAAVLQFARANDIVWIKFDPDGSVIDELKTYDSTWE